MKKLFVWLASVSICAAQAVSIGPFATEDWVEERMQVLTNDFATVPYVDEAVGEIEDKIPDVSGLATKEYVDAVSNAIPDTAMFATKEYVDAVSNAIPDSSIFSTVEYVNTTSNNLALLIDDLVSEEELGSSVSNIVPSWALVPVPPVTVEVDPAFTNWLATTNVVIDDNVGAFVSNVVPSWALVPVPPVTVEVDPAFTNWLATTNNVWLWQESGDLGPRFLMDSTGTNLINLDSLGYVSSVEMLDPIGDPLYVPTVYAGSTASTSGFGVYVDDSNSAQPVVLYSNGAFYSLRDNCVCYYYRPGQGEYGELILKTRYEDIPINRFVKCNLDGSGPYLYLADRNERYFLPTNDVAGKWVLARTNDIPYLVTTESIGALSAVDHDSGNFIEWDGSGNLYTTIRYFQFLIGDYNTAYSAEDVFVDGNALVWPRDKAGVIALTNDIPSTNGLATKAYIDEHQWTWASITNKPNVLTSETDPSFSAWESLGLYVNPHTDIIVIGNDAYADDNPATAVGKNAKTYGYSTLAVGNNVTASNQFAVAVGVYDTKAIAPYSTAVGSYNIASGEASTAVGMLATASDARSTSVGYYVTSHGPGTFNINPEGGAAGVWIGETNLATHLDNSSKIALDAIAPAFSISSVYTNGDYVIYDLHLYECTNYTGTAGWRANDWQQTTVTGILGNLRRILDAINGEAL